MAFHSQSCRRPAIIQLAVVALLCSVGALAAAQDQPAPKWEIYGGYSAFYPGCDLHGLLPGGVLPVSSCLKWNTRGAGATITYDFNRWFGLTADASGHWESSDGTAAQRIDQASFYNVTLGPKLTLRSHYFSPFVEALVGWHRLSPDLFGSDDSFGFMAGGGLDLNLKRYLAWRLFRADYVFSNHQYGPSSIVPATDVRGARLQTGLVFMLGGKPGPPAAANCIVHPTEVMVGEPVTATAAASNFNPKYSLNYTWSSTAAKITSKGSTANIDTNGLNGGSYTATAHISDPRMKKDSEATCSATFNVKESPRNPPNVSCSASPSAVQTGAPSTISCACTSPDNAPVTVGGWTASGGTISGSGSSATLDPSGASPGPITVSATCTDSRGLNTQAVTQVIVENPPPSPEFLKLEARLSLHSIYFPTAQPTIANPNGGLLASQEQTLTSLAQDFKKYLETKPNAHLTLEGHADPRGSIEYNQALSERRVERTKQFLIEHGVPEANLETKAVGEEKNLDEAQVKDAVERNPELTPEQRQRVLDNMKTILLASNRRVDITLSTTGQQSVREYPFNAADSLTLLQQEPTKKTRQAARNKAKPPTQ
jgi:outer membrane protein OmpA-like peptidoglycan-associated protein